jgi:anthranilate synthase/aminodeoxychorismate synthase-like glutamine amidotransferase
MIVLLDNHDSFVYNLDRYLRQLEQRTLVIRSDAITVDGLQRLACTAIVISPGPKTPNEAGCSLEVVRKLGPRIPILGVCLGHQAIAQACGGRVVRSPRPVHGHASSIVHDGTSFLFDGIPAKLRAARYHSLVVEESTLPATLRVTARCEEGLIMALEHRVWPVFGVQFHPESILSEHGHSLLANFLKIAGIPRSVPLPKGDQPAGVPSLPT